MANNEIASAYVALYPKFVDAQRNITKELGGTGVQAGAKVAGQKAGLSFSNGLGGSIESAGQVFQSLGKTLGNVGTQLTNKVTKPALAAGVATAGIVIGAGWGRLVQIDNARAKLTGLGHDASAVEKILDNANAAVLGTSFSLADASTAAASAVAAGVKQGADLERYLKGIGDAAAIAGSEFNDMADIFNNVQTQGRAYNGELRRLAQQGIPIYQWLAEEAGVSADAIRDMARDGEISSALFLDAIEHNIGGAAQKIGELSISAAWENIQASIGRIGANFLNAGGDGQGFFDQVKPLLNELLGSLKNLEGGAGDFGVKFGRAFADGIQWVRSNKDSIVDFGSEVLSVFKKSGDIVGSFFGAVQGFYKSLSPQTKDQIKDFGAAAIAVSTFAGPLLKVLSPALVATGKLLGAFGGYISSVSGNLKISNGAVKNFSALLNPLKGGLVAVAGAAAGIAVAFAVKAWSDYKTNVENLEKATSGLSGQTYLAEQAYVNFGREAGNAVNGLAEYIPTLDDVVKSTAELADSISQAFVDYGSEAAQLDKFVGVIKDFGDIAEPTARDIEDLRIAVEGYNRITGDSLEITDDTTGALDRSIDSILGTAGAWKELALAQVLQEKSIEVYSNLVDAEIAYTKAQEDTIQARKDYSVAVENGLGSQDQLLKKLQDTEKVEADAKAVVDEHNKSLDEYADLLADTRRGLSKYKDGVKDYIKSSENLNQAFKDNEISIDDFSEALAYLQIDTKELAKISDEELVNIAQSYDGTLGDLANRLSDAGLELTTSWADGQKAGIPLVNNATEEIAATSYGAFKKVEAEASTSGKKVVDNYGGEMLKKRSVLDTSSNETFVLPLRKNFGSASSDATKYSGSATSNYNSGLKTGKGKITTTASSINTSVSSAFKSPGEKSYSWGLHASNNFASGIGAGKRAVTEAVSSVAQIMYDRLGHTKPKKGVLSVGEQIWGKHLSQNFAEGIGQGAKDVIKEVESLTEDAAEVLKDSSVFGMDDINARLELSGENISESNLELLGSVGGLAELLKGLKVVLDTGQTVGGLLPEINNQLGAGL